jgi:mono/diheme cytochrome c family protein
LLIYVKAQHAQSTHDGAVNREDLSMRRFACLMSVLLLAAAASQAQVPGDAHQGAMWARNVCSECHAIRSEQGRSPNPRSPTFVELANTPGMTPAALTVALTTPHAGMPMFVLNQEQRQDIIAYILSLKAQR